VGRGKFRGETQEMIEVDEFWLTREEALLVCMRAETSTPSRRVVDDHVCS
jgi:hypothetical protein